MFAVLSSDIGSLKSGLLHLTGQIKGRAAKVKDGIWNLSLWNYLADRYNPKKERFVPAFELFPFAQQDALAILHQSITFVFNTNNTLEKAALKR